MPKPTWIKLYLKILDDPMMVHLSDHLWRKIVELHLLASQGGCGIRLPPVEYMAWKLHQSTPALLANLDSLEKACLVFQDEEGDWLVMDFDLDEYPAPAPGAGSP